MNESPDSVADNSSKHVAVIGSGFGGIATALRLRARGCRVTIIERLPHLGGRAQTFEREGFKHDAGPTVITAPFLFEELFELFDKDPKNYYTQVELETWYDFAFHDGKSFSYRGDLQHTYSEIARFDENDVDGYKKLLSFSEKIFKVGFEQLSMQPFVSFFKMCRQIPKLIKLQSYRTVYSLVSSFIKNPYLRKVFSIHPLLVGGNPYSTTSIYTLIHFLERKWGVHFIMGGTGSLVKALERLMSDVGIEIIKNFDVSEIVCDPAATRVSGIKASDGELLDFDSIVFNGDPAYAYKNLLKGAKSYPKLRKPESLTQYSMGLFVLFFGTKRTYPNIAHHTIWLGERHKELLADIFDRKILADDFSLYLHRPTATDKTFAPEGCDSFYALCPVPNLQSGTNWETEGVKLRNRIVQALDESILPDLGKTITADFWMTPEDFQADYRSLWGAGFSISPMFSQSAYFRYHNQDARLRNLYFAGAGTHPGAGLPGVLSSAKVVENLFSVQQARQA
jgi:phytoene desaturase